MIRFTKSMDQTVEKIKREAEEFVSKYHRSNFKYVSYKPTKKKVFLAKIIAFGKVPGFYLFINNRLFGIWIMKEGIWKKDLNKVGLFSF